MPKSPFFPESFIARIKDAVNIVQVISETVSLKKSGKNFQGLCPFHVEKTPSFTVSEEKQMFHCFGCGLGGNVFTFLMHYHHLSFPEVVAELAGRLGIPLPQSSSAPGRDGEAENHQEALRNLHQAAAEYYHRLLTQGKIGQKGRDYLVLRGIKQELVREFFLGLAPEGWDHLLRFAEGRKFPVSLLEQSGLVIKKDKGGYYDRFRNRLLFPIQDERKRVIGFGGRALAGESPKYLNSPESPLFNKGKVLYGLPQALPFIRKTNRVIIVEGYFDCLTLHQHGFKQTVATLGTALTREQIRKIKGLAEEVLLLFDGDQAGIRAALRSVPLFRQEGVRARIKVLPPEADPDKYCLQVGAERFAAELAQAEPMLTFFFNYELRSLEDGSADRVRLLERLTPHLQALESEVERSYYITWLSERLKIPETVLVRALAGRRQRTVTPTGTRPDPAEKVSGWEWHIIGAALSIPAAAPLLLAEDLGEILETEEAKDLYRLMREEYLGRGEVDAGRLLDRIEDQGLKNRISALVVRGPVEEKDHQAFLADLIKRIRLKRLERRELALSREIQKLEKSAKEEDIKSLLLLKNELIKQRKELLISSKGLQKENL
jgi:DNA primase